MGLYLNRDGEFGGPLYMDDIESVIEQRDVSGLAALEQPHFEQGYGVEDFSDGIHGDEAYLYVVELPWVAFGEVSEWAVKVSYHRGFRGGTGRSRRRLREGVAVRGDA